jgi:hypothetical protein
MRSELLLNNKNKKILAIALSLVCFAISDELFANAERKETVKLGHYLEPHWSAGLQLQGFQRIGWEASAGPKWCDYTGSTSSCIVQYVSLGSVRNYNYAAFGLGYFGQGHGIPAGFFWEAGPMFEAQEFSGRHSTLTVAIPPLFFPIFVRWTEGKNDAPRYSVGLLLKYVNMHKLFSK